MVLLASVLYVDSVHYGQRKKRVNQFDGEKKSIGAIPVFPFIP